MSGQSLEEYTEKREKRKADMATLRKELKARGLTNRNLAALCGKHEGTIGYILRGDYPYTDGWRIPKYLRVTLEDRAVEVPASLITH